MDRDEQRRLAALKSYDILYSAQEKLFDNLVELAAYIFSVPVARIAFVQATQVWHKASVGLPAQEVMPLHQALCPRAIQAEEPVLVYPDLLAHPEQSTPALRAKEVRFYAGAVVQTAEGFSLGTVCLAGYDAREFTSHEQRLLSQLARLVMQALEARRQLLSQEQPDRWVQLRETAEETLYNQMAVVRYLKARSEGQVPVPPELLEPIAKRLTEVAEVLTLD